VTEGDVAMNKMSDVEAEIEQSPLLTVLRSYDPMAGSPRSA